MKATKFSIRKECRDNLGTREAFNEAMIYLEIKYLKYMEAECNKDATIRIELHIDQQNQNHEKTDSITTD